MLKYKFYEKLQPFLVFMYKLKDLLIDFVIVLLISINYIGKSYDLIIIIFNHLIKKITNWANLLLMVLVLPK